VTFKNKTELLKKYCSSKNLQITINLQSGSVFI